MARYHIASLNYMSAGPKRCYLNMDTVLEYELSQYVYILDTENHLSGNIITEQGDISALNTRYYQYEDGNYLSDKVQLEEINEDDEDELLIPERIDKFDETNKDNKKFILLKQADNRTEYIRELKKFNSERFEFNRTFVIPNLNEDELDNFYSNTLDLNTSKEIIYPMYEIKDVCIKSCQKKSKTNPNLKTTDDDLDIYAPSMSESPIQFCQTYNNAIMLDTFKATDAYNLRIKLSDDDEIYNTELKNNSIDTLMYIPSDKLSIQLSIDVLDEDGIKIGEETIISQCNSYKDYLDFKGPEGLSDIFDDYSHLNGIKYNFIYNLEQMSQGNKMRNGNVPATDILIGKNLYNSVYSIESDHDNNLSNCREYCGIGFTDGKPYLKYYDGINYSTVTSGKDDHGKINRSMDQDELNSYGYQKIEFFEPMYTNTRNFHKSNVFSVKIKKTDLNDLSDKDSQENTSTNKYTGIENSIKKDITNAVTEICKNICPANTQLFKVYFEDD